MKKLLILLVLISVGCNQTKKSDKPAEPVPEPTETISVEPNKGIGDGALSITDHYVQKIEKAHKKEDFLEHKAVSFDAQIFFGGKEHLNGKITMLTNSTKIRIDKKDGSQLIYDGEKVFLSPKDANDKGARFDMFTWTYFFGLPYKLSDPGTQWEMGGLKKLGDKDHQTAKLTFEEGTGDAPDDWYVIYTNPKDYSLKAAAYIVTFGSEGDTSKAEADPHAIYYKEFTKIDDIPFATRWEFYGWTETKGLTNQLGEATVTNIEFIDNVGTLFEVNQNTKEIEL